MLILFTLALSATHQFQLNSVPGWVQHGNRTAYAISVQACSSSSRFSDQLKELENHVGYLQGTGATVFILSGLPAFNTLSDSERATLQRVVQDFHDQRDYVLSGTGVDVATKNRLLFDGALSKTDQGSELIFSSKDSGSGQQTPAWLISSIEAKDWRSFLLPDQNHLSALPPSISNNSSWVQSSPEKKPRLFATFKGNLALLKQAWTFLFTMAQTPVVLYGDEIGLNDPSGLMNWDPSQQNLSLLNYVQTLAQLRLKRESLAQGIIQSISVYGSDGIVAIQRTYQQETTFVIWNTKDQSQTFNLPLTEFANRHFKSFLDTADYGTPLFNISLTVAGHGCMIIGTVGPTGGS